MSELSPADKYPRILGEIYLLLNYVWIAGIVSFTMTMLGFPLLIALAAGAIATIPLYTWKQKKDREIERKGRA